MLAKKLLRLPLPWMPPPLLLPPLPPLPPPQPLLPLPRLSLSPLPLPLLPPLQPLLSPPLSLSPLPSLSVLQPPLPKHVHGSVPPPCFRAAPSLCAPPPILLAILPWSKPRPPRQALLMLRSSWSQPQHQKRVAALLQAVAVVPAAVGAVAVVRALAPTMAVLPPHAMPLSRRASQLRAWSKPQHQK